MNIEKRNITLVYNGTKLATTLCLFYCACYFISCNSNQPAKKKIVISTVPGTHEFATTLSGIYQPVDTPGKKLLYTLSYNMHFAYQLNGYAPIWLKTGKPSDAATRLPDLLADCWQDGIDTTTYHIQTLRKLLADVNKNNNIDKQLAFDTAFTYAYLKASHDLLFGTILPAAVDSLWYHSNDSTWDAPIELAKRNEKFPSLDTYRSKVSVYKMMCDDYKLYARLANDTEMMDAVAVMKHIINWSNPDSTEKASIEYIVNTELPWLNANDSSPSYTKEILKGYQYYMDIKVTGKLDSFTIARLGRTPQDMMEELRINMERARWMQRDIGDNYIVVDVPMMQLYFIRGGIDVMHMNTVVGKPERQTPSLTANMANVVINPPWGVPPTILKKDVLPGITKSGKKYLAKKGLKVYDRKGKNIDAGKVTPKNYKNYIYKQDPGDDNSLGYVKFNLPNPWDIYMHDTPHRDDFVKRNRFLSSGCIRLQYPQDMALYILSQLEQKRYTQDRLDSVIRTHKTRFEILKNRIPVHIIYLTNFEDTTGSHLRYLRDIYGRNERLMAAMK